MLIAKIVGYTLQWTGQLHDSIPDGRVRIFAGVGRYPDSRAQA